MSCIPCASRAMSTGIIHTVLYEDLVQHPREVAQELLQVCSLPWEEGVLDFQQLARPVATASLAQVSDL